MSVASNTSTGNTKLECPHCSKEFQTKGIFTHIRSKHPNDLIDSTLTKWCGEAAQGKALKVVWFKKNDFDEEEDVTIYACLATNKTFTTEERANLHFKKNPEQLKGHVKEMKKLNKEILAAKKIAKKCDMDIRLTAAIKSNDPELARILWRALFYHMRGTNKIICEVEKKFNSEQMATFKMNSNFYRERMTLDKWIACIKKRIAYVEVLQDEKCLDVKTLEATMTHFEQFNVNALTAMYACGEIFDWMKCVRSEYAIIPDPLELKCDEFYNLALHIWPGVDF